MEGCGGKCKGDLVGERRGGGGQRAEVCSIVVLGSGGGGGGGGGDLKGAKALKKGSVLPTPTVASSGYASRHF